MIAKRLSNGAWGIFARTGERWGVVETPDWWQLVRVADECGMVIVAVIDGDRKIKL